MMEMVRNAVFNMVMSLYGCSSGLPEDARWVKRSAGAAQAGAGVSSLCVRGAVHCTAWLAAGTCACQG